ncbi:winged helix-turn-helix domain-containing protein [Pantoea cypripedii]|uniref:Transcriptional regulator n=1 Tax=Pantoea cypripedii TaxID=55209 RepID=A0A1X1EH93_PANCY|nr:winged helix-turn-helix domain-containing protein [Pantoea cypripedii]MBP2199597.1 DNA-binding winged helix-turn-helix (wHTH) protein [Pantoea cypripedii]ORM88124.1 transcriptional regulator [Pantoea cypripedii]
MIYTIDGTVTYNSDDCTLNHLPTQETLSLSLSSGRLFEQLLNSNGEILTRDALLTEVWDKYGLRGSNNNLNQYLSIVRRALASFGCENLIITVPKMGIRLNTEIPITREETIKEEASTSAPDSPLYPDGHRATHGHTNYLLLLTVLMVCLIASGSWYYRVVRSGEQEITPVSIPLAGGCNVVFVQGVDSHDQPMLEKQIQQMLRENHQTCDSSRRLYFDKITAFSAQNYGRTTLSSCKLNDSGHVIACDNFYYLDWRMG